MDSRAAESASNGARRHIRASSPGGGLPARQLGKCCDKTTPSARAAFEHAPAAGTFPQTDGREAAKAARRAIACVEACRGISTEALERIAALPTTERPAALAEA